MGAGLHPWGRDPMGAGPHVPRNGKRKMQRDGQSRWFAHLAPCRLPQPKHSDRLFTFVSGLEIVLKSWRNSEGDYPATREKWVEFKFQCPP